jgi:hypothetical protein
MKERRTFLLPKGSELKPNHVVVTESSLEFSRHHEAALERRITLNVTDLPVNVSLACDVQFIRAVKGSGWWCWQRPWIDSTRVVEIDRLLPKLAWIVYAYWSRVYANIYPLAPTRLDEFRRSTHSL